MPYGWPGGARVNLHLSLRGRRAAERRAGDGRAPALDLTALPAPLSYLQQENKQLASAEKMHSILPPSLHPSLPSTSLSPAKRPATALFRKEN